jgi:hypothetical protein
MSGTNLEGKAPTIKPVHQRDGVVPSQDKTCLRRYLLRHLRPSPVPHEALGHGEAIGRALGPRGAYEGMKV